MSTQIARADVRACATAVLNSPRQVRTPVELPAEFELLLRSPGSVVGELDLTTIKKRARLLSAISGVPIRIRSNGAAVGAQPFAHPTSFQKLFAAARADLEGEEPHMRVGLAGLTVLLVHPLADGNGRLARLIWLRGLLGLGHPVTVGISQLSALYADSGNVALAALGAAHAGDASLFRSLWQQASSFAAIAQKVGPQSGERTAA